MGQQLSQEYRLETKSNHDWELFCRPLCPESWEHGRLDAANFQNSTPHARKERHAVTRLHQQGAALWILQLQLPKLLLNRFETVLDILSMETWPRPGEDQTEWRLVLLSSLRTQLCPSQD